MKTIVLSLFVNSVFIMVVEARPLSIIETGRNSASVGDVGFFDWLSLGALKNCGPSPGKGHVFTNTEAFGGIIKDSGPSSEGQGHKFTSTMTLGGIKGHKFTNRDIVRGIQDSGPSDGKGH